MASPSRGGVFDQSPDRRLEEFTESVSFDRRLYAHDIAASVAHARMLASVGLLTAEECQQIESGLVEVTVTGTEPDEDSSPGDDGLPMPDTFDAFDDYTVLTGWDERS